MTLVVSGAIDVYAFGISLWELWLSDRPYSDVTYESVEELLDAVAEGLRPDASRLPGPVARLATACWDEAATRPTFAKLTERLDALTYLAASQPATMRTTLP